MKKMIAIILLILVLGILVVGCSNTKEEKTKTGEGIPAAANSQEKQVVNDINSELIDENQSLDIGDVI